MESYLIYLVHCKLIGIPIYWNYPMFYSVQATKSNTALLQAHQSGAQYNLGRRYGVFRLSI